MFSYAEVQFSLINTTIPTNITKFQDVIEYLKAPIMLMHTDTHITIGRRLNHNNSEYYGRIGDQACQTLRYQDIVHFLQSLSIQINTRGKFILQQSALLHSIQQHNTSLLDIIEESIGNADLIERIQSTKRKIVDLEKQKKELEIRQEEIEHFKEKNEYLIEVDEKKTTIEREMEEMKKKVDECNEKIQRNEFELKQLEFVEKQKEKEALEEEKRKEEREMEEIEKKLEKAEKEWNVQREECKV